MNDQTADISQKTLDYDTIWDVTVSVITAYVSNNNVSREELPNLVKEVYSAFANAKNSASKQQNSPQKPAVPISRSVHDDYIICLEDGKKFKSMKRHLRTSYDLTPEAYRRKWDLSPEYPMVAPNYAKKRSKLAMEFGLGQTAN